MDKQTRILPVGRWIVAVVVTAVFLYLALVAASWSEWSIIVDPVERWRQEKSDIWQLLAVSGVFGAIGIGLARLALGRSPLTWWLVFALAVPLYEVHQLTERGIIPW